MGALPTRWREPRLIGNANLTGWYVLPADKQSLPTLRGRFLALAVHHRLPDVDAAAIRPAEPRALTQAIAGWIYQQTGPTGASTDCTGPPDTRNIVTLPDSAIPVQNSLEGVLVTDGESTEDQLNELRARIIEINELTQYNLLTGEALGLIRGMLIDLIEASDADPDDYIDDLDRLDQIANQFP